MVQLIRRQREQRLDRQRGDDGRTVDGRQGRSLRSHVAVGHQRRGQVDGAGSTGGRGVDLRPRAGLRPHARNGRRILAAGPGRDDPVGCEQLVREVIEAGTSLGRDTEPFREGQRQLQDVAAGGGERPVDERRNERRVRAGEQLVGLDVQAWRLFVIEVEPQPAPVKPAPAVHPAGEPQRVDAAGAARVEDDVLAPRVHRQRRIRSLEPVVVTPCPVVAGQV